MSRPLVVSVNNYRTYQYAGLVADYQRLNWAGLLAPVYMDAARLKWGCSEDEAQLAVYEAMEK